MQEKRSITLAQTEEFPPLSFQVAVTAKGIQAAVSFGGVGGGVSCRRRVIWAAACGQESACEGARAVHSPPGFTLLSHADEDPAHPDYPARPPDDAEVLVAHSPPPPPPPRC
ncbi:hypothetical protein E2C01_085336 [Portunus trituberculatus]|uniref:Uncharacterized protein n=1 Tax=Portunus trituberculatus TaxID=210409 RepID=A0A5B7J6K4_PORTR|nr:hypothetical protein [Portunus trituberculatus]